MSRFSIPSTLGKKSAVVLTTEYLPCLNTLKMVLASGCEITGVVFCNKNNWNKRVKQEIHIVRKHGLLKRFSQITVSLVHRIMDSTSDRKVWEALYGDISMGEIINTLKDRDIPYIKTMEYESKESLEFLRKIKPSYFICHTPYWINKQVREIPTEKVSIGSHLGYVPYYRGAHSAFWCMYDGNSELNGYSIFSLNGGVDSGPLIDRKKVQYRIDISFRANDLILLKLISSETARIAEEFSKGISLNQIDHKDLDPKQVRKAPGIIEYCRFRKIMEEIKKREVL
tara:strand:- start:884 stop:1735 length:852 start_codon:yes stop_codon:yes gene_type:complete